MKTIEFDTAEEAEDLSRSEWEKVLGRPKQKDDVTEFLWMVEDIQGRGGANADP